MIRSGALFMLLACFGYKSDGAEIVLHKKDAVVWLPEQHIEGHVKGISAKQLTVHHNDASFLIDVLPTGKFSFTVNLSIPKNQLWISAKQGDGVYRSDTLYLTVGYKPLPKARPVAIVTENTVRLSATVFDSVDAPVFFRWEASPNNPALCTIAQPLAQHTDVQLPDKAGNYYFNLWLISGNDSLRFQTYVTREDGRLKPFDPLHTEPTWLHDAVIYQVTPFAFVKNGDFDAIRAKLPELDQLGINTIWLQPIFKTHVGGQGYDIIDYFSLREDTGDEKQLRQLIAAAKSRGIRVMLDFVPNHSSIWHPYARDAIVHGEDSHYYNFYQREFDAVPYSSHYQRDTVHGFVYYFWEGMINLNYQHPEVQQWIIEACSYWVRKFDIDGYRLDAVWGVGARAPSFAKRLVTALKSIKPDLLLLAEDRATAKTAYQLGYDAAYDWTPDTAWISHWSWETSHDLRSSRTVFNDTSEKKRATLLKEALSQPTYGPVLRFMENNDLPRFLVSHNLKQTKMVATLLFALPGIPMLYNGQEAGHLLHPYDDKPIFEADRSIQDVDTLGLYPLYQKLIGLRKDYPVLKSQNMRVYELPDTVGILGISRWNNTQQAIVLVNPMEKSGVLELSPNDLHIKNSGGRQITLTDLITNEQFTLKAGNGQTTLEIPMPGYTSRILYLTN